MRQFLTALAVLLALAISGFGAYHLVFTSGESSATSPQSSDSSPARIEGTKVPKGATAVPASAPGTNLPPHSSASGPHDTRREGTDGFLILSLMVMSTATLFSVAISFYLYRWRRLLLANSHMVVPEAFGSWVGTLSSEIGTHRQSVARGFDHLDQRVASMEDKASNLVETFMTLHQALDEKDMEIKRLKRGYDAEIYRNFIVRFVRVDQAVGDLIASKQIDQAGVEQLSSLLADAFDECGVERFSPNIGDDYRQAKGVADNPKVLAAQNPEAAFRIAEVLEPGYRRRNQEGYEVILPAKVAIYGTDR